MTGLPKLPGFEFRDPTFTKYHRSHTFTLCNGYKLPKTTFAGIGGRELNSNSIKYSAKSDPVLYDPSLTYGRTRSKALPQYIPHFALYDKKCLTFKAFFKQSVVESPNEFYRVRQVNIIYFLEDDTITVMEPRIPNCGLDQGRLIRRAKIPKDNRGGYWHWKDLDVGKDLAFFSIVYHTVDCDVFTREFMLSHGLIMGDAEEMPVDPYTQMRILQVTPKSTKTPPADDKLRRFLEFDGKILKFQAVWDQRKEEGGMLEKCEILYFLSDDTVLVKQVHVKNDGKDPYSVLLRKMKLPKRYNDTPPNYPAIYLEITEAEVTEYYKPKDFLIGETIFVLGRNMMIYDCDKFTRDYYKNALCIVQKPAIDISEKPPPPPPKEVPPHDGLGTLEDSLQNTLSFLPKTPRKDVLKQLLNANKYLRYEMVMDAIHPEDTIRKFVLSYSLADGTCKINEPPIRNSGIIGGRYLQSTMLIKPGSDRLNPDYYTPADFYIGAMITVFEQRFMIVGADLYVYRYMQANPHKFPCEVIENMRNYMFNKGYLKDDVDGQVKENEDAERKWDTDTKDEVELSEMEKCLKAVKAGGGADPEYERRTREQVIQEYEESIKHKSNVPPYGIKPVKKTCAYPVYIGDVKDGVCTEEPEGEGEGEVTVSYTPKHIDTPEEALEKYYAGVLKEQHGICDGKRPIECSEPPPLSTDECKKDQEEKPKPLMVSKPEYPPTACKTSKSVKFADQVDRCNVDRYDLCRLHEKRTTCDCTKYEKC